jgi:hypothetical protein
MTADWYVICLNAFKLLDGLDLNAGMCSRRKFSGGYHLESRTRSKVSTGSLTTYPLNRPVYALDCFLFMFCSSDFRALCFFF